MKRQIKGSGVGALFTAFACVPLACSFPAGASVKRETGLEPPASTLTVLSGSSIAVNWFGTGPVEFSSPLCIGTSTGRYRLTVLPSSGFARLAAENDLVLSLEQDGATVASQPFDGENPMIFTGTTSSANLNCTEGQNARLIVSISEASLTSVSAGQYFDQLRLHLEAI